MKAGYVYIMANRKNGTIYIRVTSDLVKRVWAPQWLGARIYQAIRLQAAGFEAHDDLQEARRRELQMKEWKRAWKIRLIEKAILSGMTSIRRSSRFPGEGRGPGAREGFKYDISPGSRRAWAPAFAGERSCQ